MELADTRLLSRQVDSVLLVASVGIAHRDAFRNSLEELMKVGARIIGVVINRIDPRNTYGGAYDYYYMTDDQEKRRRNYIT
jgi:Mrp family chromosome partitioning ATPase